MVYPAWSENPYLTLIYLATIARGHPFRGTVGLDKLIDHLGTCGPDDVLHLHWTAPVCQAVADAAEARRRLDRFVAAVEEFRAAGGRLLWTIHNRLPHDVHHPELEVELQGFLARAADRVHVMSPSTVGRERCSHRGP
ncbi:hypothetical protein [Aeromicrobium sp. UC242_57]|uniref:hypothetical protein n=1 Tax=Aeromicrobium sp. UC242_57 TaxID=3374624 RepID=UPI003795276C